MGRFSVQNCIGTGQTVEKIIDASIFSDNEDDESDRRSRRARNRGAKNDRFRCRERNALARRATAACAPDERSPNEQRRDVLKIKSKLRVEMSA